MSEGVVVVVTGHIGKSLVDWKDKLDPGSFHRCRLTAKLNGKMFRFIPYHMFNHMIKGFKCSSVAFEYCSPKEHEVQLAQISTLSGSK